MDFLKKTICSVATALAIATYPSASKAVTSPKPTDVESAAMADTNVAVNNDFELLTNPALMEYRGTKLSLPGLNLRINDPRDTIDAVKRYQKFFDGLESVSEEGKADYMANFIESEKEESIVANLSLMPSFQLSTCIGTFAVAGYGVSESVGTINPNSLEGLVDLQREADKMKAGELPETKEFVVDKPVDVISVSDVGAAIGYAKKFDIGEMLSISGGLTLRGFERFMVDFAPSAKFVIEEGKIKKEDFKDPQSLPDKLAPKFDTGLDSAPEIVKGIGYAADLGLVLSKDFWFADAMLGMSLKNVIAGKISYSDDTSERDRLQYGIGISTHPLLKVPVLSGLLVAAETHGVGESLSYHFGASWRLGGHVAIVPAVGYQIGRIDPRGNYYGINTFTTGLTLDLRAMKLAAGYALDSRGKHQFGLGLTFGWEWDDD